MPSARIETTVWVASKSPTPSHIEPIQNHLGIRTCAAWLSMSESYSQRAAGRARNAAKIPVGAGFILAERRISGRYSRHAYEDKAHFRVRSLGIHRDFRRGVPLFRARYRPGIHR